jgi:hypothetical protein
MRLDGYSAAALGSTNTPRPVTPRDQPSLVRSDSLLSPRGARHEQRPRRELRIRRGAELAAFETVEHSLGREEIEAAFVACDDTGCAVIDFDDVGSGHRYSFTEMPALLSDNDAGFNPIWSPTSSDRRSEATSANALARISVHLLVRSHAIDLHSH